MDDFLKIVKEYLEEVFPICNKKTPNFSLLTYEEIMRLYSQINLEIKNKLICHRHSPVSAEFLFKLDAIKNLPKPIRIFLDDIDWSIPKIKY